MKTIAEAVERIRRAAQCEQGLDALRKARNYWNYYADCSEGERRYGLDGWFRNCEKVVTRAQERECQ